MRTPAERVARWITAAALALLAATAVAGEPSPTVANLQVAYAADIRAQARYDAFARRADEEGQARTAALFRAAAHAEGVRARTYADVLRRLGAEPAPPVDASHTIRTSRANLMTTVAQENAERVTVYPRLVDQARRDGIREAVLPFMMAHRAEESLVRLYQEAIASSSPPEGDLHVCETCGHVVRGEPPERCPVSLSPRSAFTLVR